MPGLSVMASQWLGGISYGTLCIESFKVAPQTLQELTDHLIDEIQAQPVFIFFTLIFIVILN